MPSLSNTTGCAGLQKLGSNFVVHTIQKSRASCLENGRPYNLGGFISPGFYFYFSSRYFEPKR